MEGRGRRRNGNEEGSRTDVSIQPLDLSGAAPRSDRGSSAIRPAVANKQTRAGRMRGRDQPARPTTAATSPGRRGRCSTRSGCYFPISDQLRVWTVIDRNIKLALEFLEQLPEGAGLDGRPARVPRAHPQGHACQREPLPGRDYCPSHKHLEETFDGPEIPLEELERLDAPRSVARGSLTDGRGGRRPGAATNGRRSRPRPGAAGASSFAACCSGSTSAGRSPTRCCSTASALHTAKAPTTPDDQSAGVLAAVEAVLERAGAEAGEVERFAHGMTVGTNALLEERGARTALVATEGFTDLLEIAPPGPAAASTASARRSRRRWSPRSCRFGGRRARRARRASIEPLDRRRGRAARRARCAALGRRVGRDLPALLLPRPRPRARDRRARCATRCPGVHVSASHEVLPQFREYERCSTTVIDAYLSPLLGRYLGRLAEARAASAGCPSPTVMLSSGGVAPAAEAARAGRLERALGPGRRRGRRRAAGARSRATATRSASTWAAPRATSAWSRTARVRRTDSREIGGRVIQLPMVDVHTVGAGGGSIAWRDARRRAARRPALGGRRARARLLRARRHRADGHRRQPAARLPRRRLGARRRRRARRATPPSAAVGRLAGELGLDAARRPPRGSSGSPTRRWSGRCAWSPSSAASTRAVRADAVRRRRADARGGDRRRARDRADPLPARRAACSRRSA